MATEDAVFGPHYPSDAKIRAAKEAEKVAGPKATPAGTDPSLLTWWATPIGPTAGYYALSTDVEVYYTAQNAAAGIPAGGTGVGYAGIGPYDMGAGTLPCFLNFGSQTFRDGVNVAILTANNGNPELAAGTINAFGEADPKWNTALGQCYSGVTPQQAFNIQKKGVGGNLTDPDFTVDQLTQAVGIFDQFPR
jgi:hypothetical protein